MTIDTANPTYDAAPAPARPRGSLSRTGLALLALMHVLVAISFLIVLAFAVDQAHAATPAGTTAAGQGREACGGTDLLATMAKSDPARLADIRAEASKVPNGDSRLWKIEAEGIDPSWLYGTMHVTDPRVLDLPDAAATALQGADTVVIETTDILDPAKAQAEILSKPELTMFTDGTTLDSLLKDDELALLKKELKERGIAFGLVSRMKPWMIASFVALPVCEQARKQSGDDFLDKKIAEDAKAKGKTVEGLETLDEQLEAMASLPMKFHLRGLVETLKLGSLMNDVMTTMTDLYLKGEIGTILPMMRAVSPAEDQAPGSGYAEFEERIIRERNGVMASRATPIIDKGDAFIAVGALHLPGDEGIVARLRKAGYTLTAVN